MEKLNNSTFGPGSEILFKAGQEWTGQLSPGGSGDERAPIRVDSYGEGEKPAIHGIGDLYTIYLYNQEYWEFHNLEITNFNTGEEQKDLEAWEQENIVRWAEADMVMPRYSEKRSRKEL